MPNWFRRFADKLRRHKDEPFFLYVPFNAVHGPLVASKDYQDKFPGSDPVQRRKLLGMLYSMDENIGKIKRQAPW